MLDCRGIKATDFIGEFHNLPVDLRNLSVKPVRHRCRVIGIFNGGKILLHLLLCHTFIEVVGRGQNQISPIGLVDTFWKERRIENQALDIGIIAAYESHGSRFLLGKRVSLLLEPST